MTLPDPEQTYFIKGINREYIDNNWVYTTQDYVFTYGSAGWIQLIDDSGDDNILTTDSEISSIPLRTDEITI